MWMFILGEKLRLKDKTKNQMFEVHVLETEQYDT